MCSTHDFKLPPQFEHKGAYDFAQKTRLNARLNQSHHIKYNLYVTKLLGLFILRFYLFIHERHRERGRDTVRGRGRLLKKGPMWDSIPGP